MTILIPVQLKRNTAAGWAALNPILRDGEAGYDKTANGLKVGDGVTAWNALPYLAAVVAPLTGAGNPNGVLTAPQGSQYSQVPGDGSATNWINIDGATTWI